MVKLGIIEIIKDFVTFVRYFIKLLGDEYFATGFSILMFFLLFLVNRNVWGYLFTILVSYLIANIVSSIFIKGSNGIVQIPLSGNTKTKRMGYGYIAFLLAIIVGTLVSAFFADLLTNRINDSNEIIIVVFSNLTLVVLVFIDFHVTFYKRK